VDLTPVLGKFLRSLPTGMPGKARLARRLMGRALDAENVAIEVSPGVRFVVPSLRETIGFHLFIDGIYEPTEIRWILSRLVPGSVYVDVGANIGGLVVPVARHVGPAGRVVAIEASPRIAKYLADNVSVNRLANVTVCAVAADSESRGSVPFYEASSAQFGMGALTPFYGGTAIAVRSERLEDLLESLGIDHVDVLKVDVEGFEGHVLAGAEKLLHGPHPPDILFEYYDWAERAAGTPGDAQRLLVDAGYQLWTMGGWLRNEAPLEGFESIVGGNMVALHRGRQ
jgi:FkbM family methyltransferase